MRKLDLGCGKSKYEGFDGADMVDFGQKYVFDIKDDWPIADKSYDLILAESVLEHISPGKDIIHVFNEAWRVLDEGGIFEVLVPNFPFYNTIVDPTHLSMWEVEQGQESFTVDDMRKDLESYGVSKEQSEAIAIGLVLEKGWGKGVNIYSFACGFCSGKMWWHRKSLEYWAGKRPRNADYGIIKWAVEYNEKGYTIKETIDGIRFRFIKGVQKWKPME